MFPVDALENKSNLQKKTRQMPINLRRESGKKQFFSAGIYLKNSSIIIFFHNYNMGRKSFTQHEHFMFTMFANCIQVFSRFSLNCSKFAVEGH